MSKFLEFPIHIALYNLASTCVPLQIMFRKRSNDLLEVLRSFSKNISTSKAADPLLHRRAGHPRSVAAKAQELMVTHPNNLPKSQNPKNPLIKKMGDEEKRSLILALP